MLNAKKEYLDLITPTAEEYSILEKAFSYYSEFKISPRNIHPSNIVCIDKKINHELSNKAFPILKRYYLIQRKHFLDKEFRAKSGNYNKEMKNIVQKRMAIARIMSKKSLHPIKHLYFLEKFLTYYEEINKINLILS